MPILKFVKLVVDMDTVSQTKTQYAILVQKHICVCDSLTMWRMNKL